MSLDLNAPLKGTLLAYLGGVRARNLDPDLVTELVGRGALRIVVTASGLAAVADDGLVRIDDVDHVQDCERVRLAARGARRRGECTCGAAPT